MKGSRATDSTTRWWRGSRDWSAPLCGSVLRGWLNDRAAQLRRRRTAELQADAPQGTPPRAPLRSVRPLRLNPPARREDANFRPTVTRICVLPADARLSCTAEAPCPALPRGRVAVGFPPFRWPRHGADTTVSPMPTSPRRLLLALCVGAVSLSTGCIATPPPPIAASASAETTAPTDFRGPELWYRQPAKEWTEALPVGFRLAHGGGHTGWSRTWIVNMWARLGDSVKARGDLPALGL